MSDPKQPNVSTPAPLEHGEDDQNDDNIDDKGRPVNDPAGKKHEQPGKK